MPSGSHCDRSSDNAKSAMLRRMMKVEEPHFGAPNPDFISPSPDGNLRMNPIQMTRMGLAWKGAKDFNDAYKERRLQRLVSHMPEPHPDNARFSGDQLMHPGMMLGGAVSAKWSVRELNPHGDRAMSSLHYQDPREVRRQIKERAQARIDFARQEIEDMDAVARSEGLSKEAREHARRQIGLGPGAPLPVPGAVLASHAKRPEALGLPPGITGVGTSFRRPAANLYQTESRRSFATFADLEARVARAHHQGAKGARELVQGELLAGRNGGNPLRDTKYGQFTSGCDVPHRRLQVDLHPIGF